MHQGLRLFVLAILPLITVVWIGSSSIGVRLDRLLYDVLSQQYRFMVNDISNDIVLIDIDEASIEFLSGWPFNRAIHARVIDQLTSAGASSITYNVAFIGTDTATMSGDVRLIEAVKNSGRAVLPLVAEHEHELKPLDKENLTGAILGHADLSLDDDGILRRSYLHAGLGFPRWPSLSLASLQAYAPVKADDFSGLRSPYLNVGFSSRWSRDYELLLPFGLEGFTDKTVRYSLVALLNGDIPVESVRNKAVFVGISDTDIERKLNVSGNKQFTSTEVHAFIFNALNQGYTLSPSLPFWAVILGLLATLCWGLLLANISLGMRFVGLCSVVIFMGIPIVLLQMGYWLSMIPLFAGSMLMGCIVLIDRFYRGLKMRKASS